MKGDAFPKTQCRNIGKERKISYVLDFLGGGSSEPPKMLCPSLKTSNLSWQLSSINDCELNLEALSLQEIIQFLTFIFFDKWSETLYIEHFSTT
ncbi:unnamed protein product [Eruca vesicaria subsp. sativa]|uniref:Uncharacterized protein n=1 Tax=Eruca vesicaria subsp. sativa TaxID=29727 RepID=A0ABC8KM29_ERUVS|nr:unnamed protein product [Eruca vesicaria subsp. sativa]